MFDISSLQYNSETPTFDIVIFTVFCALTLGIMIAFTYEKTSKKFHRPNYFLQALVLLTIVAAMVIQAIGDSVARGLGMLGALSIIRFRTTVSNPRNIVFVFSAIAAGIACGVLGFTIAIVGTIVFCATAFLLSWSSFGKPKNFAGTMKVQIPNDGRGIGEVQAILDQYCLKYAFEGNKFLTTLEGEQVCIYEYRFYVKSHENGKAIYDAFMDLGYVTLKDLSFKKKTIETI